MKIQIEETRPRSKQRQTTKDKTATNARNPVDPDPAGFKSHMQRKEEGTSIPLA